MKRFEKVGETRQNVKESGKEREQQENTLRESIRHVILVDSIHWIPFLFDLPVHSTQVNRLRLVD
jgi:hypothetical protein